LHLGDAAPWQPPRPAAMDRSRSTTLSSVDLTRGRGSSALATNAAQALHGQSGGIGGGGGGGGGGVGQVPLSGGPPGSRSMGAIMGLAAMDASVPLPARYLGPDAAEVVEASPFSSVQGERVRLEFFWFFAC
jgi:hypothetical protein